MTKTHVYCDRCGREITDYKIPKIRVLDFKKDNDFYSLDICPLCMLLFWNFMEKRVLSYSDISKESLL